MKQQKFEKAFRQAVNKVITDDSRESELLKQKQIIAGCKNKLAASGMLLYYFSCCGDDQSEAKRVALANDISEKLFVNKSPEEEFWSLSAKDLFETLLMLLAQDCGSSNPVKEFYNLLAMTQDIQKFSNKLEQFSQSDEGQQFSKIIQRFLSNSEATKTGIVAHMNNQLLGFMRFSSLREDMYNFKTWTAPESSRSSTATFSRSFSYPCMSSGTVTFTLPETINAAMRAKIFSSLYVNVVSFIFMLLKRLRLSNLSVSSVDFGKNIALLTNHSTPP